jgi:hypothetical protein
MALLAGFSMTGCGPDPFFVPVMSISGVPDTGTTGIPLALSGTVNPGFANNRTIVWLVKEDPDDTGATVSGNELITQKGGIVTITAKIVNGKAAGEDFTQEFTIEFEAALSEFEARINSGPAAEYYLTLSETFDSAVDGDTITVLKNISSQAPITISGMTITLVSDGANVIQLEADGGNLFTVESGATLKLGGAASGELTLRGISTNDDALVFVNGGTLELNANAKITGNTNSGNGSTYGGGVYVDGGTFTMNGGSIEGNATDAGGGGVYVNAGSFNMKGGIIAGNQANMGGGVICRGSFEMSGGIIYGSSEAANIANTTQGLASGASLYVVGSGQAKYGGDYGTGFISLDPAGQYTDATLPEFEARIGSKNYISLQDAFDAADSTDTITVLKNITSPFTGYNLPAKSITLTSGTSPVTITLGSAGRLFTVGSGSTLKIQGASSTNTLTLKGRAGNNVSLINVSVGTLELAANAVITGNENTAGSGSGGGVNIDSGGKFRMSGGRIGGTTLAEQNSAAYGGGVCVTSGGCLFEMSGGTIIGNKATTNGGGVCVLNGSFMMSGGTIYGSNEGNNSNTAPAGNASLWVMAGGTAAYDGAYGAGTIVAAGNGIEYTLPGNVAQIGATPYRTLQDAFTAVGNNQTITVIKDITGQPPVTIPAGTKTINLVSDGTHGIQLGSTGSLFTVGSGITLRIGDSSSVSGGAASGALTLKGRTANSAALVTVDSGGNLLLADKASITGNTNSTGGIGNEGGGVNVKGTFTMSGGSISGNTSGYAGGVAVQEPGGIFTMSGGTISGNNANNGSGGGVNVSGIFTMSGGIIYGNEVKHGTNRNTATTVNSASLYINSGTSMTANYADDLGTDDIIPGTVARGTDATLPDYLVTVTISGTDKGYMTLAQAFSNDSIDDNQTATVTVLKPLTSQDPVPGIWGTGKNITLTGQPITLGSDGSLFTVGTGTFKVQNITLNGKNNNTNALITVNGGALDLAAGALITGNTNTSTTNFGGGVSVSGAGGTPLTMSGGRIEGNSAQYGGGVYFANTTGAFTMTSGFIGGTGAAGNKATSSFSDALGGGVFFNGQTFTMGNGAVIQGNSATAPFGNANGGGVYLSTASGTLTMNAGSSIKGNTSGNNGGGVYVNAGNLTISNGTIEGNTATTGSGGGVFFAGTTFSMSGTTAAIHGNSATNGGGAYIAGGTFTMSGGIIGGSGTARNSAANGGGVALAGGTVTMSGGTIEGNNASGNGGGAYVSAGTFTLSGGYIYGSDGTAYSPSGVPNTAPTNGGASLYVQGGTAQYGGTLPWTGYNILSGSIPGGTADTLPQSASKNLQNKIDALGGAGTIAIPAGTYTLDETIQINDNVTITTENGAEVTLERPAAMKDTLFYVNNAPGLTLTAGTGGKLTIKSTFDTLPLGDTYSPLIDVRQSNSPGLVLTDNVEIINTQAYVASGNVAVRIQTGGKFTMEGGRIEGFKYNGAVYVSGAGASDANFIMEGGIITNCASTQGYGGGVTIGSLGNFTMSGTAEISGNTSSSNGGGVSVNGTSGDFIMNGGTIRNNYVLNPVSCYGGGVYAVGNFTKNGGTIYGIDAGINDWNRITNSPNPYNAYAGQGYAVYCTTGPKWRDNTAGTGDNMKSAIAGTAGGWE